MDCSIFLFFPGHYSKVNIVRYHPCAQGLLTTASYDLDVKLWDINSGNELITLKGHSEPVSTYSIISAEWSCEQSHLLQVDSLGHPLGTILQSVLFNARN